MTSFQPESISSPKTTLLSEIIRQFKTFSALRINIKRQTISTAGNSGWINKNQDDNKPLSGRPGAAFLSKGRFDGHNYFICLGVNVWVGAG